MEPDPLSAFLSSLGTVGPVGLTVLGGWYMYLKLGSPPLRPAQQPANPPHGPTPEPPPTPLMMHQENRDMLRDIHQVTTRTLLMEERANEALARVAEQQARTADVLERLEERASAPKRK